MYNIKHMTNEPSSTMNTSKKLLQLCPSHNTWKKSILTSWQKNLYLYLNQILSMY